MQSIVSFSHNPITLSELQLTTFSWCLFLLLLWIFIMFVCFKNIMEYSRHLLKYDILLIWFGIRFLKPTIFNTQRRRLLLSPESHDAKQTQNGHMLCLLCCYFCQHRKMSAVFYFLNNRRADLGLQRQRRCWPGPSQASCLPQSLSWEEGEAYYCKQLLSSGHDMTHDHDWRQIIWKLFVVFSILHWARRKLDPEYRVSPGASGSCFRMLDFSVTREYLTVVQNIISSWHVVTVLKFNQIISDVFLAV